MRRGATNEILLGIFFILVIGLLIFMFRWMGNQGQGDDLHVNATFDSVAGLVPDNAVMVAGVPIGSVEAIEVRGNRASVRMRVQRDADLRSDVKARIRARSLLGEKYIELLPQSSEAALLENGARIVETESPTEPDEIFSALKPFFDRMAPAAPQLESILTELDRLLKQLNEAGDDKGRTISQIIDNSDRLLQTANRILDDNEKRIGDTLERMERVSRSIEGITPAMMERAEKTLKRIETVAEAIPEETLREIPDGYRKLDRILDAMLPAIERLDDSGEHLDRILNNLDILMKRVLEIDELALRKFLQQEGINVNLTQDAGSRERIEELLQKARENENGKGDSKNAQ